MEDQEVKEVKPDKPRRGRKRKGPRPKCEYFLQGFKEIYKVIYPSTNSPDKMGICVFKKDGNTLGIARFTQNDKGDIYWSPRVVRNAGGGRPIYIYDLIEVPAIMIDNLSTALSNSVQFFGGEPKIKSDYVENVTRVTEERHERTLDDKIKNFGVL